MADEQIVRATTQLPLHPDGLIQPPQSVLPVPDVTDLRKMFDEARSSLEQPRKDQQRDRDWYDGPKQLSSEVRQVLKARMQPAIYTNRIRPAINGILGVMEGSRVDPRAYPRNAEDEQQADLATKTLRFVADETRFDETKLDCAETFWIEGETAAIIECSGEDITVTQIRWEEFFYDPRSRRSDYKDARYLGFAKWLSTDLIRQMFPVAYARYGEWLDSSNVAIFDDTWGDRPNDMTQWVNRKDRRALVVTLFHQVGATWVRTVYCAAGVLESGDAGYYCTRNGQKQSLCPIEAQSCYIDRENRRYGQVRDMVPIQDEINARRSRLLHLANSRQIQEVQQGAAQVDADSARLEASRADGVIPSGWQMVPTADLAAGQQVLLAESKAEIERMGPTPAILGRSEANQSGRSRLVLQQAGLTELARPMARFNDFEERCYRQMWWRAQQFWRSPKWIRVTDDVKSPEYLQINEPVMGMVMQQMQNPETGEMIPVPSVGVTGYTNRIAELDMDILVETVPESANLQQEVFAELTDMIRAGLDPFSPQFELLVEMSPLADKARVLEKIRKYREEVQKQQAAAMQAQAEAVAKAEAREEATTIAEVDYKRAQTAETEVDTMVKAFNAGQNSVPQPVEAQPSQ